MDPPAGIPGAASYAYSLLASVVGLACALALASGPVLAQNPPPDKAPPWDRFVTVEGHANPISANWVESDSWARFTHDLKIPNPVPADSGYRFYWTAKKYWEHLCATEAGSFIFKTVDNVDGLLFLRDPGRPSDSDHRDRWKREAPGLQASWQLKSSGVGEWASWFINPPWATYEFIEQPDPPRGFYRFSGYVQDKSPMRIERITQPTSRYALTWRGIRRPHDREKAISGAEWIVFDRTTNEVLAVLRDYYLTGMTSNESGGIWWLNAARCPFKQKTLGWYGGDAEWAVWTPRVLRPRQYPKRLETIDVETGAKK